MDNPGALLTAVRPGVLAAAVTLLVSGCSLMVNPFSDELADQAAATTPSAEGVRGADPGKSSELIRPYDEVRIAAADGGVTHAPLYFEDSFEDAGSDDGRFAWTGEDYLQLLYWRGRFLVNAALFPISLVTYPPWTVMESDGHPQRRCPGLPHDPRRWTAEN